MKLLVLLLIAILFVGCLAEREPDSPPPTPTQRLFPVTVVVTATPEPTLVPGPIIEPTATAIPTLAPTPEPLPTLIPLSTLVPLPTLAPLPTLVPLPTIDPVIIHETVHVTVIVTATSTPTPTPTPTVTPTPTRTPVPTATPIPPFIQHSAGKGSWLSTGFNFWNERPIEIDISVSGSGSFSLSAVTPSGCVINLSSGVAPYTATTLADPSPPEVCDGLNQFGNGTRLTVVAGGSVNWIVDMTQYSQPIPQNAPFTVIGTGQNIFGPVRLGQGEYLAMISNGNSPFLLDAYSIYEPDSIAVRVIDAPLSPAGTWRFELPLGIYMIAVNAAPDRDWTAEIYYP